MPSVEELLSVAEADTNTRSASDSRIEIDADTRIIQMMPQDELFGVESDEKSERKYFKVPKIVGNGVDLSKLQLRINYQNASKLPSGKDMYIVTDATVYNDEWVYFSWELSRKVTLYKGTIYFVVCAVKADSKGNITNEWNTTLAMGKVLEGLEVETSQEQQYQASDYLEQLKQQLLQYSEQIKETFPDDYTETVENVKNLQNDVKKLDDNKITKFYTNNQGQKVLNDSDDGKIQDLMIYGKSEQKQYKGKNLLNYTKDNTTINGVTFTVNADKTIIVNGTAINDATFFLTIDITKFFDKSDSIKIVGCPSGGSKTEFDMRVFVNNGGIFCDYGSGVVVSKTEETNSNVAILVRKGYTANNLVFKPMVTTDTTATYADYEPYVGGKPSPSPEYPQEIKAVVNPTIKTHGKNLIDITNASKSTNVFSSVTNGRINVKKVLPEWSSSYVGKFNYKEGDTVTIWVDALAYGRLGISGDATKIPDNSPILTVAGGDTKALIREGVLKVTLKLKYSGVVYVWFCSDINNSQAKEFSFCIQVEKNNTATDFQPYQETQATLPYELYAIPVESGGNVTIDGQQYIADYVDVEHGKLVRKTHVTKFTGAENWTYTDVDYEQSRRFGLSMQGKSVPYFGLSNYVINGNTSVVGRVNVFAVYETWIDVRINKFTSLVEFKNFLSEINSSGKPMIVIHALATPEEIDLMPEAIEEFKALSTYYPKTYITAESEQLEAYTMFNYPVSMEKGWEYVKQQISDDRKYIYDMDTKLTETEASTLEAKIDTAILSEMVGG